MPWLMALKFHRQAHPTAINSWTTSQTTPARTVCLAVPATTLLFLPVPWAAAVPRGARVQRCSFAHCFRVAHVAWRPATQQLELSWAGCQRVASPGRTLSGRTCLCSIAPCHAIVARRGCGRFVSQQAVQCGAVGLAMDWFRGGVSVSAVVVLDCPFQHQPRQKLFKSKQAYGPRSRPPRTPAIITIATGTERHHQQR